MRRALTSARRKGLDLAKTRATAERLHRPGQSGTGVLLRLLDSVPWEGTLPATWFEELLTLCLEDIVRVRARELRDCTFEHEL